MPTSKKTTHMEISFIPYLNLKIYFKLLGVALLLTACSTPTVPPVREEPKIHKEETKPSIEFSAPTLQPTSWLSIDGWRTDDIRLAWPAFLNSCAKLGLRDEWQAVCETAQTLDAANGSTLYDFFENNFIPYHVLNSDNTEMGTITGYYEPLLHGSRIKQGKFIYPLYSVPDDLIVVDLASLYPDLRHMRLRGRLIKTETGRSKLIPYYDRAELESGPIPQNKILVWVDDAIDAFFLQIQGSGRIQLDNGEMIRLNYADQNGYPYKSIGRWLIEQGELKLENASMQGIKNWVHAHPQRLTELLNTNPSYVFFRELPLTDIHEGPIGALGIPLTPERSIAIDPRYIPLGVPIFLATTHPNSTQPLQRLMLAQDTGGAIRGAVRADFFWGFGNDAGERAGKMRQQGKMWVLLPRTIGVTPDGKVAKK